MEGTPREQPFDESTELELPKASRTRRQMESTQQEAIEAIDTGLEFDARTHETETLRAETDGDKNWSAVFSEVAAADGNSESEEFEMGESVTRDLKSYLSDRKDVLNGGDTDESLTSALGYDVCTSAALVDIIIDEAKAQSRKISGEKDPQIRVEDLVPAWQIIEQRIFDNENIRAAEKYVKAHGISGNEAHQLRENDPAKLKKLARLLDAPPAVELSRRLAEDALRGQTHLVDVVMARVEAILSRHTRQRVELEAGDPQAIARKKRNPLVQEALMDALRADLAGYDKSPPKPEEPQDEDRKE